MISSHSNPLIVAQHLSDHTRVYTTAPKLVAPIAQIHCIFALPSVLPQIPGETPALLEWMQRGTESYSRSEIFDAFGAIGIEPQLSMLPGAVLFSMQCLDACREQALLYAQELLYRPAFEDEELQDVLKEFDEDDNASKDNPGEISHRAQRRARWNGTTLAAPVNGTRKTRKDLDADYLKTLHETVFRRPAIIAIASEHRDAWINDLRGHLVVDRPARIIDYVSPTRSAIHATPRDIFVNAPTLDHAIVARYSLGPSPSKAEAVAAAFLHHEALTDGMSSPFMTTLRGEKALSYAVSSMLIDRGDGWDQCYEIEPSPDRVDEALDAGSALWNTPDALSEEDFRRGLVGLATNERLQTLDARRALAHALRHEILWNRALGWREDLLRSIQTSDPAQARSMHAHYGMTQEPLCTIVIGKKDLLPASYRADMIDLDTLFDGWPD